MRDESKYFKVFRGREREGEKEGVEGCGVSTDEILQVIGKDSW